MGKRQSIQPGLRWHIFARDAFTCRYCGEAPPHAILHVDHVLAVKLGGKNSEDNLVTACENCNSGKGSKLLVEAPKNQQEFVGRMQKFGSFHAEYPQVTGRLIDVLIRETEHLLKRGVPDDVCTMIIAMAALDLTTTAFTKSPLRAKRDFMKMCSASFDDNKAVNDPPA